MERPSYLLPATCIAFGVALPFIILEIAVRAHLFDAKPVRGDRPKHYYLPIDSGTERDYAYSTVKPPNTFRIAIVGDSFTFGDFVQFDDTFPKRLERWLNFNKRSIKVEVLNLSKPGYSSADEDPLVQYAATKLSADLVLLEYTLNDPEIVPYRANRKIVHGQVEFDSELFKIWRGLGFIMTRYSNWKSRREFQQYYFDLFDKPETWNRCVGALTHMRNVTTEQHVRFAAVVFPLFNTPLDETYPYRPLHQKVMEEFSQLGVPALDLYDAFSGIPNERLEVVPGENGHPDEIAHRIAAESIYSWFKRRHLVSAEFFARQGSKPRQIYNPYTINAGAEDVPAPPENKVSGTDKN